MRLPCGQIVVAQVAIAGLAAAAAAGTPLGWSVAVPAAAALLGLSLCRLRRRPLYAWCATALRYTTRDRRLPAGAPPAALLALVAPGAVLDEAELAGTPVALVEDAAGLTAVLDLGGDSLLPAALALPAPHELVPMPPRSLSQRRTAGVHQDPVRDEPAVRVQVLISGVPAPALHAAAGLPATSYRQLTQERVPARCRTLLAVRACRDDPGWTGADLRRPLCNAVQRIRRRLRQDGVTSRPLDGAALIGALAELAHHEPAREVREDWAGLRAGGLHQASVLLHRWPGTPAGHSLGRLFGLPATSVTVSATAGPEGEQVVLRLAAPSAGALAVAQTTLHRLLAASGGSGTGLDGEQLDGLAATLPLARMRWPRRTLVTGPLRVPGAGLVLGRDRRGEPVAVRLARPEPTRVVLAGGVRAAALLAVRSLALGTQVVVRSTRPDAWRAYLPGDAVTVLPADQPVPLAPAGALAPQLVVLDTGGTGDDSEPAPWRTTLVVCDGVAATDLDALARADLVVLQPLSAAEAALAGGVLRLGASQEWLATIRADMVGLVSGGVLRWAQLAATPVELQVIGAPERAAPQPVVSG